jgi:hypothetical protein
MGTKNKQAIVRDRRQDTKNVMRSKIPQRNAKLEEEKKEKK